jgi:ketosteroid isomerase-like protein
MNHVEIAEALFAALAGQDNSTVRKLCAPSLRVRQNNGPPMGLETLLAFNAAVGRVVKGFRYANPVRSATADGFVEEHAVQGELPDGRMLDLAVCVVAQIKDSQVVDVREYFDSAAAAGLIEALG